MKRTSKLQAWKKVLNHLALDSTGQEIAEAAAVLPLMFLVLLGIFWFGQAFSIYGTTARAAHEAALAAAESTCTTCTAGSIPEQNANNTLRNILTTANLNISNVNQPTPNPNLLSCGGTTTVPCESGYAFCYQGSVQLSTTAAGAVPACGVSVSFVYQYQFWLPFTSLNKQTINIRAAAQAPLESR